MAARWECTFSILPFRLPELVNTRTLLGSENRGLAISSSALVMVPYLPTHPQHY